jgi:hypothetical protein
MHVATDDVFTLPSLEGVFFQCAANDILSFPDGSYTTGTNLDLDVLHFGWGIKWVHILYDHDYQNLTLALRPGR